jgi:hypothetical protein
VIAVGISGSREYPRLDLVRLRVRYRVELHGRGNVLFVHGAARGVDRTADEAARELGAATRPLPVSNADWARLGALAERCIDWLDRHRPKRQRPTAGSVV